MSVSESSRVPAEGSQGIPEAEKGRSLRLLSVVETGTCPSVRTEHNTPSHFFTVKLRFPRWKEKSGESRWLKGSKWMTVKTWSQTLLERWDVAVLQVRVQRGTRANSGQLATDAKVQRRSGAGHRTQDTGQMRTQWDVLGKWRRQRKSLTLHPVFQVGGRESTRLRVHA